MAPVRIIAAALIPWLHTASSFTPISFRPTAPTTGPALHRAIDHVHDRKIALSAIPPPHNNDSNELHLLTFDLDDTIFPIGPVVADANIAQLKTLVKFGYENAANEEIIAASKQIRTELRAAGDAITYSDLRKQSIRREIERVTEITGDDKQTTAAIVHDSVVETIFDAWLSERHASADRNLFPHASDALQRIREEHPGAVIGAITNGRGNPLEMPSVASYFDFCISGEDEGVFPRRKPDKGIYEAALSKYNEMQRDTITTQNDSLGLRWIHVGDDLANDVGASAECGAKSIWFTAEEDNESEPPIWSTATEEELQRRAAMGEMARGHVSAKICSLDELPGAIFEVVSQ